MSLCKLSLQALVETRVHWQIENRLHWQREVSFGEDAARSHKTRQDNGRVIIAVINPAYSSSAGEIKAGDR